MELEDGLFDGNALILSNFELLEYVFVTNDFEAIRSWESVYIFILYAYCNCDWTADFLELTLQFGMIMMFACALPPAFAFAAVVLCFSLYFYHEV